jgi:polyribonucleotide nucleotidyltransferase
VPEGIDQILRAFRKARQLLGELAGAGVKANLTGLEQGCQIAHQRVEKVEDFLKEGQIVRVKVLETDEKGRIKLSMKALLERPEGMAEERYEPRGDRGDRPPRRDRDDRPRRDRPERDDRPRRDAMPVEAGAEAGSATPADTAQQAPVATPEATKPSE